MKEEKNKTESTSGRNWKRRLPKSLLGAVFGALIALNYVTDPTKVVPAMFFGALIAGFLAYYYA